MQDEFPDMATMARLSSKDYSHIESLEQIRPPYPAYHSPEWWALRKRYDELMRQRVRRLRSELPTSSRPVDEVRAHRAAWTALGNEAAKIAYERDGKPRERWLAEFYVPPKKTQDLWEVAENFGT
jgi:hypothetical protein